MTTTRMWQGALGAIVLAGLSMTVGVPSVSAACHAFTIKVAPASVTEGAPVKVTVTRDAAVADSSIKVTSVNGTATGGSDYAPVNRTISFTGNKIEESFDVATINDAAVESSETFRLHMSDPGGCAVNRNFVVGPDAEVTITDDDQIAPAPTTTAKPVARPTTKVTTTTTAAPTSTTTTPPTVSSTTDSTTNDTIALETDDDEGSPGVALLLGLGALAVLGGIGYLIYQRRATPLG